MDIDIKDIITRLHSEDRPDEVWYYETITALVEELKKFHHYQPECDGPIMCVCKDET